MPKLSILICTMPKRKHFLEKLQSILNPQLTPDVEVLTNSDDGSKTIGKKRNELLKQSTGQFVCFVDDDDIVSEKYVSLILNAIDSTPDCTHCELKGIITEDGENPLVFHHSTRYPEWKTNDAGNVKYERTINHLNAVRRDIAVRVGFPELNHGEDHCFSQRLLPFLGAEAAIEDVLYHYLFVRRKS